MLYERHQYMTIDKLVILEIGDISSAWLGQRGSITPQSPAVPFCLVSLPEHGKDALKMNPVLRMDSFPWPRAVGLVGVRFFG
jgi:hypothetical protein